MTRDELARLGIAVGGIARGGLARGGLTLDLLFRRMQADLTALKARVEQIEAKQQELLPKRRKNQKKATDVLKKRRAAFVARVDAEMAKSDEVTFTSAIIRVLRKPSPRTWDALTKKKRRTKINNAKRRYTREKNSR